MLQNQCSLSSRTFAVFGLLFLVLWTGCSGVPKLHPITGKITLGGKSYERLIVYFRPIDQELNQYTIGVGETDVRGDLTLYSTAGEGLAAGKYRVSFTYTKVAGSKDAVGLDEKADDDPNAKLVEMVPPAYTDPDNSPLEFEVKAGEENFIEFDIPLK